MSKLKALIFDVDGTLADTERDGHRIAFNRAFAEVGLDWQWSVERYGQLLEVAGGKERLRKYVQEDHPNFVPPTDIKTWSAGIHQLKNRHYKALVQEGLIPLRTGVKRLIQEARKSGVRLAIATTSAPENVIALLETMLGSESPAWFDVIAAGDVVPTKKPAPDIYQYVLAQMNLKPEQCLVFEDSHQGLSASLQAGLKTVVTRSSYTQADNFTGSALILEHLGEPDRPFEVVGATFLNTTSHQIPYFDLALARQVLDLAHQRSPLAPNQPTIGKRQPIAVANA
jgi:HAD superfamily hydrolase (TIGR01509 family)